jgi:hypothetical protein
VSRLCAPVNRLWAPGYRRFFTTNCRCLYNRFHLIAIRPCGFLYRIFVRPCINLARRFPSTRYFQEARNPIAFRRPANRNPSQLTSGHPLHPLPSFVRYLTLNSFSVLSISLSSLNLFRFSQFLRVFSPSNFLFFSHIFTYILFFSQIFPLIFPAPSISLILSLCSLLLLLHSSLNHIIMLT